MNKEICVAVRFTKEKMATALACWLMSVPDRFWVDKIFNPYEADPEKENQFYCRFTLNNDGFDAGEHAPGHLVCAFSYDASAVKNPNLTREQAMHILFGHTLDGILAFTPELTELPEVLAYQVHDQLMAFNQQAGRGVYKGLKSDDEVYEQELLPRTYVYLREVKSLH